MVVACFIYFPSQMCVLIHNSSKMSSWAGRKQHNFFFLAIYVESAFQKERSKRRMFRNIQIELCLDAEDSSQGGRMHANPALEDDEACLPVLRFLVIVSFFCLKIMLIAW